MPGVDPGFSISNAVINNQAPEPGTLALLASTLVVLGGRRILRRLTPLAVDRHGGWEMGRHLVRKLLLGGHRGCAGSSIHY